MKKCENLDQYSVSILYRKSVGKPISGIDQQKFDAWYNESEKSSFIL